MRPVRDWRPLLVDHPTRAGVVELDADVGVAQQGDHVVVAGQHPPLQQLGPVDRVVRSQPGVLTVRRLDEPGLERIERTTAVPPLRLT